MENFSAHANHVQMRRRRVLIILYAAIFIFEVLGVIGAMRTVGVDMFRFYTNNSNLLNLVVSGTFLFFAVRECQGRGPIPPSVQMFTYLTTCCLVLTFFVVIFVLCPMDAPKKGGIVMSYCDMLTGSTTLYTHTLCPILTVVAFVYNAYEFTRPRVALFSVIPTLVYGLIVIPLNIMHVIEAPYSFLHVLRQPVYISVFWVVAISVFNYVVGRGVLALRMRRCRRLA